MERTSSTPALACRTRDRPRTPTCPVQTPARRSKTHEVSPLPWCSHQDVSQVRGAWLEPLGSTQDKLHGASPAFNPRAAHPSRGGEMKLERPSWEKLERPSLERRLSNLSNISDLDDGSAMSSPLATPSQLSSASNSTAVQPRRPRVPAPLNGKRAPFAPTSQAFRLPAIDTLLTSSSRCDEADFSSGEHHLADKRRIARRERRAASQTGLAAPLEEAAARAHDERLSRKGSRVKVQKKCPTSHGDGRGGGHAGHVDGGDSEGDLPSLAGFSDEGGHEECGGGLEIGGFEPRAPRRNKTWAAPKVAQLLSELSTPSSVAGSPLASTALSSPSMQACEVLVSPTGERVSPCCACERVSPSGGHRGRRSPGGSQKGGLLVRPGGDQQVAACSPQHHGFKVGRVGRGEDLGWRKGTPIGRGSYGCVYRALDRANGHIFAVKECQIEDNEEDKKLLESLEELAICRDLRHPNIVSYLGHSYQDNHIYIYLEYVAGGSVADVLREFGPLVGLPCKSAIRGSLEGLNYLHTRNPPVVHRDIKGANILVDLSFHMKLADFGCSKRNAVTRSFTTIGSIPWMAPEVILQQNGYGRKADIWSFGCLAIEMASAQKPWGNAFDNMMAALAHIGMSNKTPDVPEGVPQECCDFIRRCVVRHVDDRPSAAQLLQDPYLQGLEEGSW